MAFGSKVINRTTLKSSRLVFEALDRINYLTFGHGLHLADVGTGVINWVNADLVTHICPRVEREVPPSCCPRTGGTSLVWLALVYLLSEVTLFTRDQKNAVLIGRPKLSKEFLDHGYVLLGLGYVLLHLCLILTDVEQVVDDRLEGILAIAN